MACLEIIFLPLVNNLDYAFTHRQSCITFKRENTLTVNNSDILTSLSSPRGTVITWYSTTLLIKNGWRQTTLFCISQRVCGPWNANYAKPYIEKREGSSSSPVCLPHCLGTLAWRKKMFWYGDYFSTQIYAIPDWNLSKLKFFN